MSDKSKNPREKLDELIREFGRGNYHHVNDTEKRKSMSFEDCQATYKYLSNYQSLLEQCEKLAKALEKSLEPNKWFSGDYPNDGHYTGLAYHAYNEALQALENYEKFKESSL